MGNENVVPYSASDMFKQGNADVSVRAIASSARRGSLEISLSFSNLRGSNAMHEKYSSQIL